MVVQAADPPSMTVLDEVIDLVVEDVREIEINDHTGTAARACGAQAAYLDRFATTT